MNLPPEIAGLITSYTGIELQLKEISKEWYENLLWKERLIMDSLDHYPGDTAYEKMLLVIINNDLELVRIISNEFTGYLPFRWDTLAPYIKSQQMYDLLKDKLSYRSRSIAATATCAIKLGFGHYGSDYHFKCSSVNNLIVIYGNGIKSFGDNLSKYGRVDVFLQIPNIEYTDGFYVDRDAALRMLNAGLIRDPKILEFIRDNSSIYESRIEFIMKKGLYRSMGPKTKSKLRFYLDKLAYFYTYKYLNISATGLVEEDWLYDIIRTANSARKFLTSFRNEKYKHEGILDPRITDYIMEIYIKENSSTFEKDNIIDLILELNSIETLDKYMNKLNTIDLMSRVTLSDIPKQVLNLMYAKGLHPDWFEYYLSNGTTAKGRETPLFWRQYATAAANNDNEKLFESIISLNKLNIDSERRLNIENFIHKIGRYNLLKYLE